MPNAPPNETATIQTNLSRTFTYSQATTSSGNYELTIPYSTEGPVPGETQQFDMQSAGAYTVSYGDVTAEVRVSEMDVL